MDKEIIIGAFIIGIAFLLSGMLIRVSILDENSLNNLTFDFNMDNVEVFGNLTVKGNYKSSDGSVGYTGTCNSNITVKNGLIISCD